MIRFKTKKAHSRLHLLHPQALHVLALANLTFYEHGQPFVVTDTVSTLEEDKKLGRKHATHRTGRAFDVSIRGVDASFLDIFVANFNETSKHVAAYSESRGELALVIQHGGTAPHLHFQIHARYALGLEDVLF